MISFTLIGFKFRLDQPICLKNVGFRNSVDVSLCDCYSNFSSSKILTEILIYWLLPLIISVNRSQGRNAATEAVDFTRSLIWSVPPSSWSLTTAGMLVIIVSCIS